MPVLRIDLDVPDAELGERVFGTLLGGRPAPAGWGVTVLQRSDRGAAVALSPSARARATLDRIVLGVEDLDAVIGRLRVHGVPHAPGVDGVVITSAGFGLELEVADARSPAAPRGGTTGTAGTTAFDHVCLAVASLADTLHLLREVLGGQVVFGGHNHVLGTLSSQVTFGAGTRLELLQPIRPDAAIARFLDRRGPGLHHLTWHVADVAVAAAAATDLGLEVVDTDVTSRAHWRETYVRPASAMGLLVQLAWTDQHHDVPLDDAQVAAILAGRVDSYDFTMRPA